MKSSLTLLTAGLLAVTITARTSAAPFPRELIQAGKSATALVGLPPVVSSGSSSQKSAPMPRILGSAFCIHSSGLFLTGESLVRPAKGKVQIILNPNEKNQRIINATVIRQYNDSLFALLRAEKKMKYVALPLGNDARLFETQELAAFGFKSLRRRSTNSMYPNVSVTVQRITSLMRKDGALRYIELEPRNYSDNTGGPVLDENGKIVGLNITGMISSRYAMPVKEIIKFLSPPVLTFQPPEVLYKNRSHQVTFALDVQQIIRTSSKDLEVQLTLDQGKRARTFQAKAQEKLPTRYLVKAAPVAKPKKNAPLNVSVQLESGSLDGQVLDQSIRIGKEKFQLSNVHSIVNEGKQYALIPLSGQPVRGPKWLPDEIKILIAGQSLTIKTDSIQDLTVKPPTEDPGQIAWKWTVKAADKIVAEQKGELALKQYKPSSTVASVPTATRLVKIRSFPAPGGVAQIVLAAKARRLFVRNSGSQISVMDTATGRILEKRTSKERFTDIDLSPDESLLFVADYGKERAGRGTPVRGHHVHRYRLATKEWEVAKAPKIALHIEAVDNETFILLEGDQHVNLTLNRWKKGGGSISEVVRARCGYRGNIEYDNSSKRLFHGSSGSSSREILVFRVSSERIAPVEKSGTYSSGKSAGGTVVLSTDGRNFYYGALQVDAMDIKLNRVTFPEKIVAASANLAFGQEAYYHAKTGKKVGQLDFKNSVYGISSDGKQLGAFDAKSESITLYHIK